MGVGKVDFLVGILISVLDGSLFVWNLNLKSCQASKRIF